MVGVVGRRSRTNSTASMRVTAVEGDKRRRRAATRAAAEEAQRASFVGLHLCLPSLLSAPHRVNLARAPTPTCLLLPPLVSSLVLCTGRCVSAWRE